MDEGHGRIEKRAIQSTDIISKMTEFPYVAQAIRVYRQRTEIKSGKVTEETSFYITSMAKDKADKKRLLQLIRGHWGIETKSHYVRDVTFGEDRSRIRKGSGPRIFASMRNLAISIFRLNGVTNIAKALRHLMRSKEMALDLIGV